MDMVKVQRALTPPQPVRLNINAEVPTPFVVPWSWYTKQRFYWQLPKLLSVTVIADGVIDEARYAALVHEDQQFGLRASFNQTAALEKYIGYHLVAVRKISHTELEYTLSRAACPCSSSDTRNCGTCALSNGEAPAVANSAPAAAAVCLAVGAADAQPPQPEGPTAAAPSAVGPSEDRHPSGQGGEQAVATAAAPTPRTAVHVVLSRAPPCSQLVGGQQPSHGRQAQDAAQCAPRAGGGAGAGEAAAVLSASERTAAAAARPARVQSGSSGSTMSTHSTATGTANVPLDSIFGGAAAIAAAAGPLQALAVRRQRSGDRTGGSSRDGGVRRARRSGSGSSSSDEEEEEVADGAGGGSEEAAREPMPNNPFRKGCCSCPCHVWRQYWPDPNDLKKQQPQITETETGRGRCRGARGAVERARSTDAEWKAGGGRGRKRGAATDVRTEAPAQPARRPRLGVGPPLAPQPPQPPRPPSAGPGSGSGAGRAARLLQQRGQEVTPREVPGAAAGLPEPGSSGGVLARSRGEPQQRRHGAAAAQPAVAVVLPTLPPAAAAALAATAQPLCGGSTDTAVGRGCLGAGGACAWPQPAQPSCTVTVEVDERAQARQRGVESRLVDTSTSDRLQQQHNQPQQPKQPLQPEQPQHPKQHQSRLLAPPGDAQPKQGQEPTPQAEEAAAGRTVVVAVADSDDDMGGSGSCPDSGSPQLAGPARDHISIEGPDGQQQSGSTGQMESPSPPQEKKKQQKQEQTLHNRAPRQAALGPGTPALSLSPDAAALPPAQRSPQPSPRPQKERPQKLAVAARITAAAAARARRAVANAACAGCPSPNTGSAGPSPVHQQRQRLLTAEPQHQQHLLLALTQARLEMAADGSRPATAAALDATGWQSKRSPADKATAPEQQLPPARVRQPKQAPAETCSSPHKHTAAGRGIVGATGAALLSAASGKGVADAAEAAAERPALRLMNRQPVLKRPRQEGEVAERQGGPSLPHISSLRPVPPRPLWQGDGTTPPFKKPHQAQQQQQQQAWMVGKEQHQQHQQRKAGKVGHAQGTAGCSRSLPPAPSRPELVLTLPGRAVCRPGWDVRAVAPSSMRSQPESVITGSRLVVDSGVLLPEQCGVGPRACFLRLFVERDGYVDGHTAAKCVRLEEADDGSAFLTKLPSHAQNCVFLGWGRLPGGSLVLRVRSKAAGVGSGGTARPEPSAVAAAAVAAGAVAAALERRRLGEGFTSPLTKEGKGAAPIPGRGAAALPQGKREGKLARVKDLLQSAPLLTGQLQARPLRSGGTD